LGGRGNNNSDTKKKAGGGEKFSKKIKHDIVNETEAI
jgi:hypothetical protein